MNFDLINPFSEKFLEFSNKDERIKQEKEFVNNSLGMGEDDKPSVGDLYLGDDSSFALHSTQISFNQYFDEKENRISKYREMSEYPEISLALDMVCDEAICKNSKNESFQFKIEKTSDLKRSDIRLLQNEFSYLVNNLFNFEEVGWDLFWKYIVDGELFLEVVLDEDGESIIGFKPLSSHNIVPIYENGVIIKFVQSDSNGSIFFERNQILYTNFGKFGRNKQDVRGYLDPTIKIFNQLRNLEDAVIIYRLVRAPERRVWNIEVGQAPTGKAEEIVRQTMNRFKSNFNYDSETGLIDSSKKFQALTEDFWFARRDGSGSTVDVLSGGTQLGELEDLVYFLRKMYKSLKIPSTRWGDDIGGHGGSQYTNRDELEREELNFTKFIERLQTRFKRIIEQAFLLHLQVKGFDEKFLDRTRYSIHMEVNNHFRQYRDKEMLTEKLEMLNQYGDLILSEENPNAPFSEEFFMRYIVNLPGNWGNINQELRNIQKEQMQAQEDEEEGDGDGDDDFREDRGFR